MSTKAFQDYYSDETSVCYGCGRLNDNGLHIRSFWDGNEDDPVAVCVFRPKPEHTAIEGFVYGGLIASIIDCHSTGTAAAALYRHHGLEMDDPETTYRCVTGSLHVDYLAPTPIDGDLVVRSRATEIKGRKVVIESEMFAGDTLTARGNVVAISVSADFGKKIMLIDTHCHLDFNRFDEDRDAVVERALEAGVTRIIIPAIDLHNCEDAIQLTQKYEGVFCAVGVHPNSSAGWQTSDLDELRGFAKEPKVVAIGEIGLDYYWDKSPKAVQHQAFVEQMQLADELDLPVIVHNRESSEDVISLLWASPLVDKPNAGVMHSFSAPELIAKKAVDLGFYLGFTGPLTFKKAGDLRQIAAQVPLDRILLETDAPFLSPHPKRGKRNEPAYVPFIADRMAALHGVSVAEIGRITTENAVRLFNLPES